MSYLQQTSLTDILNRVYHSLSHQEYQGYVVGGIIRDSLLGRQTSDVDIAVSGNAPDIARLVADDLNGKFVLLDSANSIARVIVFKQGPQESITREFQCCRTEWHLDFSSFSGDIESDLARRDFTVNAMAMELSRFVTANTGKQSQLKLIDPFSGEKDSLNKVLRAVSDEIFESDAARLLRAVRLAAELDFTIAPETENLIRHHSQSITRIAGERIREELLRLLSLPKAAQHLLYLDSLGLLLALIPELAESKGVGQPTVHFWDVFEHSVQTVAAAEFLMRENDWEYGHEEILAAAPWSDLIDQHLSQEISSGSNRKVLLKLGGLLHDIAKPRTKSIDDTGRARFLGHPKQGAAITANILERLRFSNKEINLVESLVYHHLRPVQMANEGMPTQRAIYRYFRDTGDAGIDILLLALADHLASRGPLMTTKEWKEHCQLAGYILSGHEKQQDVLLPVKLIDGHDLINTIGLSPGSLIGELLSLVRESQASGEITTREEALALAQKELNKLQSGTRSGN